MVETRHHNQLSDAQLIVLSEASLEALGRIRLPARLRGAGGSQMLERLAEKGMIEPDDRYHPEERPRFEILVGQSVEVHYRITLVGLAAIGLEPDNVADGVFDPGSRQHEPSANDDGSSASPSIPLRKPPTFLPSDPLGERVGSKIDAVVELLRSEAGASIADLQTLTGWQPHSVRAALTGLRKRGHLIERINQDGGKALYRITSCCLVTAAVADADAILGNTVAED